MKSVTLLYVFLYLKTELPKLKDYWVYENKPLLTLTRKYQLTKPSLPLSKNHPLIGSIILSTTRCYHLKTFIPTLQNTEL